MLINKKAVKTFALAKAAGRAHKFELVGRPFYDQCEGALKSFIRDYVKRLPSKGKTIN